jgi:hypothetical protein
LRLGKIGIVGDNDFMEHCLFLRSRQRTLLLVDPSIQRAAFTFKLLLALAIARDLPFQKCRVQAQNGTSRERASSSLCPLICLSPLGRALFRGFFVSRVWWVSS